MMRQLPVLVVLVSVVVTACGGGGGGETSTVLVPPDDPTCTPASDEVVPDIQDRIDRGDFIVDDATSYQLTAPTEGQTVPSETPFTFRWNAPMAGPSGPTPRHQCGNGRFLILHFEGLDQPLDVVGGCTNTGCAPFLDWTPDAATWARFQNAAGPIVLTVSTAPYDRYASNGDITRPTDATTTFHVAAGW